MKKIILASAIALMGMANAQTFGVKAGMNVSNISNFDNAKAKIGINGGVFMNAPIATNFSIQPELLYNSKGVKYDVLGDYKLNLDYISVPIMLQYNATPQFYFEVGPEFSFLMSAKLKGDKSEDYKELVKGFDIGIGLGAGYYFTPNVGVNARYIAGLTDVAKENEDTAMKNGVFQIGLSYKFGK